MGTVTDDGAFLHNMTINPADYEKLGAFYLGREYDVPTKQMNENLVMYDSRDLVTHGVVLGMTGSGKTGLCLTLLEEAAIDKIPAIIIDPKGDIANFMLMFPELNGAAFRPWINEEDASRKGKSPDEFAAGEAEKWGKGLADWGQDASRISMLQKNCEVTIFTPGSTAGIPISILASLAAPDIEIIEDSEIYAERVESTASSILGMLGVDADPISSREHILLSRIFDHAWRKGENLDLEKIIGYIQAPPFSKIGVIAIDEFFTEKKRGDFALQVNNLIAAPGFQQWLQGVPLDIKKMMHTEEGKPRVSIFSIAHLNDSERMFFVSLLLNQMVGWMRAQSGTTSLRALFYMDEIYGYLPPTANPPSKKPMMILLKQARAFGLGILVATQNPVDLDYKALSNIGTWFLGRLQTERDKNRVLDGLEGAAATQGGKFDRATMERLLSALGNRIFLMNNVHEDQPCVFQVRWCMTYLRGPLTRGQIKALMDPLRDKYPFAKTTIAAAAAKPAKASKASATTPEAAAAADEAPAAAGEHGRPDLPASLPQYFLPVTSPAATPLPLVYTPAILTAARISYVDKARGISGDRAMAWVRRLSPELATLPAGPGDPLGMDAAALSQQPAEAAAWAALPQFARKSATYTAARDEMVEHIFQNEALKILYSEVMEVYGQPGETEGQFRARLQHNAREERDKQLDLMKSRYAVRFKDMDLDREKLEQALAREQSQARTAKMSTAVSIGQAVLGALFGRKSITSVVSRGATAARGAGRAYQQSGDVGRVEDKLATLDEEAEALKLELEGHIKTIQEAFDLEHATFTTAEVKPMKKNIAVTASGLAWIPFYDVGGGSLEPAFEPGS